MANYYDPEDQQLLATATALLDQRSFDEAHRVLSARIAQNLTTSDPAGIMLLAEIAGLLIDTGSEGRREEPIKEGLALLEANQHHFDGLLTPASVEYNLGNAKSALADLRIPDAFTTPGLSDHELLLAAKNHYWKALKLHPDDDNFAHQLRTNLGTTLRKSGRIAEALAAYDDVLASDPSFTMAHFQRGFALLALERLSGTVSTTQLQRARADYVFVADAADAAPGVRESAEKMRKYLTKRLGNKAESAAEQQDTLDEEARQHSAYRQFTLLHHVGLAEHGLYCHCNGARRDDLMVAAHRSPVTGDHIPRCELILNRLKAEFGTARLLYYEATHDHAWNPHDEEITYADLFEGEQLSMRTELLRTSFRLCLGILDKIAHGICELYDVAEHHERLYFESFWRPAARKGKASTRWDTLATKSKNPSLVALYSQATDLASAGEWALFKAWRNDLEHRFLILTRQPAPSDLLKAREGTFATRCVPVKEFTNRTLHLLQFTRSAIFNFTYCVRAESRADEDEPGFMMTLLHK